MAAFLKLGDDPLDPYRRVTRIFLGAEVMLALAIVLNILGSERQMGTAYAYAGMLANIATLHVFFRAGSEKWALRLALWSAMILLTIVTWTDMGLRDQAFLAYGILFAIAAALETRLQYRLMVSTVLGSALMMGIAKSAGWMHPRYDFEWNDVIDVMLVHTLLAYCIGTLSDDWRDMVERYRQEAQKVHRGQAEIAHLVQFDTLTGLTNRHVLRRNFEDMMARQREGIALFFVDIDDFKAINDSHGHASGDQMLVTLARRLEQAIPGGAELCRFEGDQFLVASPAANAEAIAAVASALQAAANLPVEVGIASLVPSCSIGIARAPADGEDFDTLLRKADIALNAAKTMRPNGLKIYEEGMNPARIGHLNLASRLRGALAAQEFELVYQPHVSLVDGRVEGAEALLRWLPEGGPVLLPDDFIPIAEAAGIMPDIGRWVLQEACRQCRQWQEGGLADLRVSVNISRSQLRDGTLDTLVLDALMQSGLAPRHLEIELYESVLNDINPDIFAQLGRISRMGVRLSIGDFGQGYSNLVNRGMLEINAVKIGRHFTRSMQGSGQDRALMRALAGMGATLGVTTIAEGVESQASEEDLRAMGFTTAQGFHWSYPLHPSDFTAYVQKNGAVAPAPSTGSGR